MAALTADGRREELVIVVSPRQKNCVWTLVYIGNCPLGIRLTCLVSCVCVYPLPPTRLAVHGSMSSLLFLYGMAGGQEGNEGCRNGSASMTFCLCDYVCQQCKHEF